MDNYLILNGKRIDLTEEQIRTLTGGDKIPSFERQYHTAYNYITDLGHVLSSREEYEKTDDDRYNVANYCTDENLMDQRALHETLNRLLWRFSMEHGGDKIDWTDINADKFHIFYDYENDCIRFATNSFAKREGTIYFISRQIVQQAIEEIVKPFMEQHPEFVW